MPMTIGSLIRNKWLFTTGHDFSCNLAAFLDNTVIGEPPLVWGFAVFKEYGLILSGKNCTRFTY